MPTMFEWNELDNEIKAVPNGDADLDEGWESTGGYKTPVGFVEIARSDRGHLSLLITTETKADAKAAFSENREFLECQPD